LASAGRFFAETMEESEKEPQEALAAIGASRFGISSAPFCQT
jgi:ABC-type phosphate/phosphonate transport system permease subunit